MDLQPDTLDQPSSPAPTPAPRGRKTPRSRSGCWTCRSKKVKCDEGRPQCRRCLRLKLLCDYIPRRKDSKITKQAARSKSKSHLTLATREPECPDVLSLSPTSHWFQSLLRQDEARPISTFRMLVPPTSSSSVTLTAADHEAIRYFRTTFAKLNHSKNPDYSLYSIMFKVAEVNPIVMHMVLAVGGREMEFQKRLLVDDNERAGSPVWHYSSALKLMAQLVGNEIANPSRSLNVDSLYTALYLMLLYEQRFGDRRCTGLINHLDGAAIIFKHQCGSKKGLLPTASRSPKPLFSHTAGSPNEHISLYAARIIMWIVQFDSAAASYGLRSQLHSTLSNILNIDSTNDPKDNCSRVLDQFEHLHHFSSPLYRTVWGRDYPQDELLDDVENRNIFFLEGACVQLRIMVAQLSNLPKITDEDEDTARQTSEVEHAIEKVRNRFSDLIELAAGVSISTDNSHGLVANLRRVVPLYYAVVLYFLRLRSAPDQPLGLAQVEALRQIMNLAFQAHKYDGEKAMIRIAWPLFLVGLETNDHLHREWVLNRFNAMSSFGCNFRRASQFLARVVEPQSLLGQRVDIRGKLQSGGFDLFVI